jgi:prolyl-tRNA synthetase
VITDFARQELKSYKQLPINFYQIQTKFRDEIRPRFGVMRAREFMMKDAYSFHIDTQSLAATYTVMYNAYNRIFNRLGLRFRAVQADTGTIGGNASHEFQVLAESGEDAIAWSDGSDYAANVELAEAMEPSGERPAASVELEKIDTPSRRTIDEVATFLSVSPDHCVKTLLVRGHEGLVALCVRGDHEINEIKVAKLAELPGASVLADESEILKAVGTRPGFIGPVGMPEDIPVIVDRSAALLADFVCGGNTVDTHYIGANWERDARITRVADLRKVVEGDPSPDGQGQLHIARGIEVGHVFQLGGRYAQAMSATVLDENGKARPMLMGCYGIGVSRIVAAAIEQNHDERGIVWPDPMAPWSVVICVIGSRNGTAVQDTAHALYEELQCLGIDVLLDDRGLRPGPMFADMELIGIPHRVVVSERGIEAGTFEYRHRSDTENQAVNRESLISLLTNASTAD